MKPGMQRDILVAYWLLFDEFGIGDDDAPPGEAHQPSQQAQAVSATEPEKPKPRANGGKGRRRS
jgi:hypothetical protein